MTAPLEISNGQRQRFHSEGYLVIPNVLPRPIIENAVREIAAFIEADLDDCSTWYRNAPQNDGIVPMHHAQSLWDIRQYLVDINRCMFRPPWRREWPDVLGHAPR